MRLHNKVAIITGGSRGIGAGIAEKFCEEGASVVINYKSSQEQANNLCQGLQNRFGKERAMTFKADVTKVHEINAMFSQVFEHYQCIDILINNAGINQREHFEAITEEAWDSIFDVNLKGPFLCCQSIFPIFKRQNHGRIINISSVAGQYHGPKTVHYAVSKAGLNSLTKVIARYGAEHNIFVNAVAPGLIPTEQTYDEINSDAGNQVLAMTLLKKAGKIQDVASACLFLAEEQQQYMTGQVLAVSGGAILAG